MFSTRQTTTHHSRPYAIPADFCRIFEKDMNRLYLLSYMLTGEHRAAEECFVRGLEDSTRSNRIFRDWAKSWARRMIIQSAILMVRPRPVDDSPRRDLSPGSLRTESPISAVLALPVFERFVFVATVLERYSHQECSLLLACSREDVLRARERALQHLAEVAERFEAKDSDNLSDHVASALALSA